MSNATFAWTSRNPSIATVTTGGLATPASPGLDVVSVTQTNNGQSTPVTTGELIVTGNGACTLNPGGLMARNTLKYTVGTNGELSGGPTVYSISG